ncbi:MAG: glycosyltransferase [bacterium]|nr:glycosyltransferase [bacterium]
MKIFAVGAGPLPFESSTTLYGLGYRTWHIVKPLLDDGHQVRLVAVRIPTASESGLNLPLVQEIRNLNDEFRNLRYFSINEMEPFLDGETVQKLYDEFRPDCIVGINGLPASVAAKINRTVPFWADLNGWLMAEAQSKSARIGSNQPIDEFWQQEERIIRTADIFSTVSIPQKYALLGELATIGRLSAITTGYEFVYHIPNSFEPKEIQHNRIVIRNRLGQDAFVILWSGGYNTWTDIDTLFNGITRAMKRDGRIWFVSTGGALPGHDEKTYIRFQELIQHSEFTNRFLLRGWIPSEDVFNYYFESDIGINIDTFNYETVFGARNRLLHMMKLGLPVLTTLGTEISYVIAENRLGLTFEIGNADQLAEQIHYAISHPQEMKEISQRARQFVYSNYTCEKTAIPLREWVKSPKFAPDNSAAMIGGKRQNPEFDASSPIQILKSFFKKVKS